MREMPRFTLRLSKTLQEKIDYTSSFNCRSKNKEIEFAIKRYINDFERLHGNIALNDDKREG